MEDKDMIIDDEWKNYERHPIVLNKNTVMLIELFERYDRIEDFWKHDVVATWSNPQKAAVQFMLQLEGQECDAFLIALRDLINGRLQKRKEVIDMPCGGKGKGGKKGGKGKGK
jgi:hypothetical protein